MVRSIAALFLFLLLVSFGQAREPLFHLSLFRTRTAAVIESQYASVSVHFDLADLSLGAESYALLSTPVSDLSKIVPVRSRVNRGIFSFRVAFDNPEDLNGNWTCIINAGTSADEYLQFSFENFDASIFLPYPDFPEINYQADYRKVLVRKPSSSGSGSGSGSTASQPSSSESFPEGIVYTFPDGETSRVTGVRSLYLPGFYVYNRDGAIFMEVDRPRSYSQSRVDFSVSDKSLTFQGSASQAGGTTSLFFEGMEMGKNYRLLQSLDLSEWEVIAEFLSPSNGLLYTPSSQETSSFFMMEIIETGSGEG